LCCGDIYLGTFPFVVNVGRRKKSVNEFLMRSGIA
jgi:hypothetical protein